MKIDKDKYYTAGAVYQMGILPWKRSSFYRALREPKWASVFSPIASKKKTKTMYYIPGWAIIKYVENAKKGGFSKE